MLKTAVRKPVHVGPEDDGRRMALERFDRAIGREGYLYELNKGVIEVTNVPAPTHGKQVQEIRNQLVVYQVANPGLIDFLAGPGGSKLLIGADESERHPDLSTYLSPPPTNRREVWAIWIPEIVIEVVSESSVKRDYQDKPDEYLHFGVREYWIVDALKQQMTALTRQGGQWKPHVLKPTQKYTTRILPGFSLNLKRVLTAGK